jgi:hypothetical protein
MKSNVLVRWGALSGLATLALIGPPATGLATVPQEARRLLAVDDEGDEAGDPAGGGSGDAAGETG